MKVLLSGIVLGFNNVDKKSYDIDGSVFDVEPHQEIAIQNPASLFHPFKVRNFGQPLDLEVGDNFEEYVEIKGQNIKFDLTV